MSSLDEYARFTAFAICAPQNVEKLEAADQVNAADPSRISIVKADRLPLIRP